MIEFKVGDVVCLKSGGPDMTVVGINTQSTLAIGTAWFAGAELKHGSFVPETLDKVD